LGSVRRRPGRGLPRPLFLKNVNLGKLSALKGRIAVVGGGNVAVDSARTAMRLGHKRYLFSIGDRGRRCEPILKRSMRRSRRESGSFF